MSYQHGPTCGVCGQSATVRVCDLKEIAPEGGFARWEPDGAPHNFCAEHARPPQRTYCYPGTEVEVPAP